MTTDEEQLQAARLRKAESLGLQIHQWEYFVKDLDESNTVPVRICEIGSIEKTEATGISVVLTKHAIERITALRKEYEAL